MGKIGFVVCFFVCFSRENIHIVVLLSNEQSIYMAPKLAQRDCHKQMFGGTVQLIPAYRWFQCPGDAVPPGNHTQHHGTPLPATAGSLQGRPVSAGEGGNRRYPAGGLGRVETEGTRLSM